MATRPAHLIEREFNRLLRTLEVGGRRADRTIVTAPEVTPRHASLGVLRLIALLGAAVAAVVIFLAFSVHLALGVVAVLLSPAVPLGLVVGADRVLAR